MLELNNDCIPSIFTCDYSHQAECCSELKLCDKHKIAISAY